VSWIHTIAWRVESSNWIVNAMPCFTLIEALQNSSNRASTRSRCSMAASHTFRRVGSIETQRADLRIVAAPTSRCRRRSPKAGFGKTCTTASTRP